MFYRGKSIIYDMTAWAQVGTSNLQLQSEKLNVYSFISSVSVTFYHIWEHIFEEKPQW